MDDGTPQLRMPNYDIRYINNSHIGDHGVLAPTDFKSHMVVLPRQGVPFLIQRQTLYEDFNRTTPEWRHPPFEKRPTVPYINQGYSREILTFPIIW
jgi:hypothetical protein